jgi:hypothetical protein
MAEKIEGKPRPKKSDVRPERFYEDDPKAFEFVPRKGAEKKDKK